MGLAEAYRFYCRSRQAIAMLGQTPVGAFV